MAAGDTSAAADEPAILPAVPLTSTTVPVVEGRDVPGCQQQWNEESR